jgi:enoyl-CoA hydratase/carnithine racemase
VNEVVSYELHPDASTVVITMHRPEVRNALNLELYEGLAETVERFAGDDAVRTLILTGSGDKAFSAGADFDELLERSHLTETGGTSTIRRGLTALLENMPKPTIAAINGHAVAGGLELAIACTFRLIVPSAKIGFGEINLGLIPGNGGTQRTVRLIGLGRALELVLTGRLIEAAEAEQIGLISRIVKPESLMGEALELATLLGSKSPLAITAAKEALLTAGDVPLTAGLALENKWFAILNGSPHKAEAIQAFREKRAANFE